MRRPVALSRKQLRKGRATGGLAAICGTARRRYAAISWLALGPLLGIEAVRGSWRKGNKLPSAQALPKDRSHWRLLTRKWMRFPDRGNFLTYRPLVSSTRERIGGAQLPVDVLRPATAALPAMSEREPIEPLTVAEFRIIAVSPDSMLRRGDRKESCFAPETEQRSSVVSWNNFPIRLSGRPPALDWRRYCLALPCLRPPLVSLRLAARCMNTGGAACAVSRICQ